jgi:hypothetical protein
MSPPQCLAQDSGKNFSEEANVTAQIQEELLQRFLHATTTDKMDLREFSKLLIDNGCCSEEACKHFFRAFDRDGDGVLSLDEFSQGCVAADPLCTHVLNSFTGFERTLYAFDYYCVDRGRSLEYTAFCRLLRDCAGKPRVGLQNTDDFYDKISQLDLLKDVDGETHFERVSFRKLYEFVSGEELRGTSKLFRFRKSIALKSRPSRRAKRTEVVPPLLDEDEEMVANLLNAAVWLQPFEDDDHACCLKTQRPSVKGLQPTF